MRKYTETANPLNQALQRARGEPTISLRDAGLILGRSYNFMLRLVLELEARQHDVPNESAGIVIFPGVCAYRLGKTPGSHYIVPSAPLLSALGLQMSIGEPRGNAPS
jgi:hypothetical protein